MPRERKQKANERASTVLTVVVEAYNQHATRVHCPALPPQEKHGLSEWNSQSGA